MSGVPAGRQMSPTGTLRIGEALKRARTGQGMDVRTAEERTKIRIRYLRALEAEQWDMLPNSTYAKGFLRTYATMLGLDADRLVDEFRRQVETNADGNSRLSFGEPVLERRVRPWERTQRRSLGFL
jgi:cytoskeletal protein RodZ